MVVLRVLAAAALSLVPLVLLAGVLLGVAGDAARLASGAGWWALVALVWPAGIGLGSLYQR